MYSSNSNNNENKKRTKICCWLLSRLNIFPQGVGYYCCCFGCSFCSTTPPVLPVVDVVVSIKTLETNSNKRTRPKRMQDPSRMSINVKREIFKNQPTAESTCPTFDFSFRCVPKIQRGVGGRCEERVKSREKKRKDEP